MRISKSKFVAGVQCLKRLYWQVHETELAAEPEAATDAIIEQGREVGLLARQLFPGGVEVHSSAGLDQAIRTTKELIANPEVPAIFEGAFENQGVIVKTDILQRREENASYRNKVHSRLEGTPHRRRGNPKLCAVSFRFEAVLRLVGSYQPKLRTCRSD
jgi:hypothetical protein